MLLLVSLTVLLLDLQDVTLVLDPPFLEVLIQIIQFQHMFHVLLHLLQSLPQVQLLFQLKMLMLHLDGLLM